MTQFFRSGIMEYDKRKIAKTRKCETCPAIVPLRKRFCGPCYDLRLEANIAANRHKYTRRNSKSRVMAPSINDHESILKNQI